MSRMPRLSPGYIGTSTQLFEQDDSEEFVYILSERFSFRERSLSSQCLATTAFEPSIKDARSIYPYIYQDGFV